ncbi:unnamed protein product [marine sediment metagenome]|uniref:Uncharacterized protein n=1 Tax=marine sediment metagenome TaxID=412755 RepID=X1A0S1_9ZZZZ
MSWVMIPQKYYDMMEEMRPTYNSLIMGGADEKQIFKWLGEQIQYLYREGYPGVLVCSELSEMLVD